MQQVQLLINTASNVMWDNIFYPTDMVAVVQWQSVGLWFRLLWVRVPFATPVRMVFKG